MNEKQIPWKLIIRSFKYEMTEAESHELNEWLASDTHREVYHGLRRLWERLMQEGAHHTSDADHLWKQMQQRMHSGQETTNVKTRVLPFRRWMAIAASVLIIVSLGFATHWLHSWNGMNSQTQHYAAVGGKSLIELPDGSTVWLNKGAEMTYTASPLSANRQVELQGEAFFHVTKNTSRPFIVDCSGMKVKVLGTSFNVDAPSDAGMATVSLLDGSVAVSTAEATQTMVPGEKATYDKATGALQIEPVDASMESLWAAEELSISEKTLRETTAYLEKWFDVSISVSPRIDDNQSYTLVINRDDTIEDILETLSLISKLECNFIDKNNIEIVKP